MSASAEQINQWLEEGLRHYGLGDPAKALDVWLQVLAIDADNTRAKEYVEIVRSTYGDEAVAEAEAASSANASEQTAPPDDEAPSPHADTPAEASEPAAEPSPVAAEPASEASKSEANAGGDEGHPQTAPSIADPLPITNVDDAHVDPLDSIDGPSWADVAADAESASSAFNSTAYSTSALHDAKTEISVGAENHTIVDDDSDEGAPVEARTSGAAGPVLVEASDDSGAVEISTSASVKIGGRATPIEESASETRIHPIGAKSHAHLASFQESTYLR